jgi:hypothetical protein
MASRTNCSPPSRSPSGATAKAGSTLSSRARKQQVPIAFIYPCPKNNVLVIFVAGKASIELGQWSEQQIFKDVDEFLSLFLDDDEYDLEQTKMASWHLDEHCFGLLLLQGRHTQGTLSTVTLTC